MISAGNRWTWDRFVFLIESQFHSIAECDNAVSADLGWVSAFNTVKKTVSNKQIKIACSRDHAIAHQTTRFHSRTFRSSTIQSYSLLLAIAITIINLRYLTTFQEVDRCILDAPFCPARSRLTVPQHKNPGCIAFSVRFFGNQYRCVIDWGKPLLRHTSGRLLSFLSDKTDITKKGFDKRR